MKVQPKGHVLFFLAPKEEQFLRSKVLGSMSSVTEAVLEKWVTEGREKPPDSYHPNYQNLIAQHKPKKIEVVVPWNLYMAYQTFCEGSLPRVYKIPMLTWLMRRYLNGAMKRSGSKSSQ